MTSKKPRSLLRPGPISLLRGHSVRVHPDYSISSVRRAEGT